ncbi:hypothetical protein OHA61_15325 [Streptomyces sp. NBC_00885]|uniref:hypothetical protein n=1 Tax=Streptomyces sp. NBC_00885 TaxID=2975857 RepID=UPI003867D8B8|nr:hypothetical protein OHA61_15325 [Streptomyces sp. NBC_00885]
MKESGSMGARTPWPWRAWDELTRDIQNAYEDIGAPRRSFVSAVEQSQPYRDLVHALSEVAELNDDTDVNCDVCFSYVLESDGLYFVRLSMVGLYATFERLHGHGGADLVTSRKDCSSDFERDVFRLLTARGFHVLSEGELNSVVDLAPPDIDNGAVTVRNAIFSPEE